jgi:hypothetical protein
MMKKFLVKYALGGGFGGIAMQDGEVVEFTSYNKAADYAYEMACADYDSYDGMHGLQNEESISEENPDWSSEAVYEAYCDERGSWLEYSAEEITV